jgi:lipopolysaccharide heptosyltransferase II
MISTKEPFNWSRFNNLTAAEAQGEFFLFLNDDVEVIESDWLDNLLEHAMRPEVGVVGPQLLYPDRRVQHAGLFLTRLGAARHAFRFLPEDEPGYFGLALTQRNVIAVTGACLLTPRRVFEQIGRFSETHSVVNNDLDFCLRAWQQGLLVVFTPHAKLIHHELVSRSRLEDDYNLTIFANEWRKVYQRGDPYYHQRLSADFDDFRSDHEPIRIVHAGHPLFAKDAVHRILVVKLDHIGDCVTALPAVRRLKSHFPNAKIYVLAAPSTRAIWSLEPVIEEIIDFTFFHARSGLGTRELSSSELEQLLVRLQPYRFDIAIDLRKSPDTRHILQYTGASHVTGFDSQARFPWLDISLEWEGDRKFTPKRQHVADDLINLVDAVAAACEPDRLVIPRSADGPLQKPMLSRLFDGRLVCVHPTAGTEMRQWPKEYFAELIDLLVEQENVNIALIGGPGEEEVNADILERVRHPEAVSSLLGELALSELPGLLTACALFVGNNSGPQHIAAGLGVPTVGIHSGVIDSLEWGPLGPHAVAIRREMTCSPCYLTELKDCYRDLACMKTLLPRDVFQVCKRLLALGNGRQRKGGRGNQPSATKGPRLQSSRRQRTGSFERTTPTAKDRQ